VKRAVALLGTAALLAAVATPVAPPLATAAGPPQVAEVWVTDVTATSANLRARINPEGSSTTYRFEYLTEAAYEAGGETFAGAALAPPSGASSLGAGSEAIAIVQHVGSLAAETTYRYRVRATSGAGTEFSSARLFTTTAATSTAPTLDSRGLELVSPPDKDGGAVGAPESLFGGGAFQAAAEGDAFTFSSTSSFGAAAGAPPVSQYLSTRVESSAWSTRNISAPLEAGGYGDQPDGAPFRIFSGDLERGLMLDGTRCAVAGTCPPSYSLWHEGALTALPTSPGLRLAGVSPDLRHAVFTAAGGLYEWSGGGLQSISAATEAELAAPVGAISEDGLRIYFTAAGDLFLHQSSGTVQVDSAVGGGAEFQAASDGGSVAFFAKAGHLYRFQVGTGTEDLTPAGGLVGVLGIAAAGDTAYYQDGSGLQRWHAGSVTTAVAGAAIASPGDYPPASATARVSADGEHLAFLSAAAIPPFDNTDAVTGASDTELYLFGPPPAGGSARLVCVSCNPTGERPRGSSSIPGTFANGSTGLYRPRALSEGGSRIFFDSSDRLLGSDTNSGPDVYEWEADGVGDCARQPGCIGLVSGGRGEGASFLDASVDGSDAFFLTGDSLVSSDPGSIDVYDARVLGGFPEPPAPIPCKGDGCQPLPSPPDDPATGTSVTNPGNPEPHYSKERRHRRHHGKKRRRRRHRHGSRHRTRGAAG